MTAAVYYVIRTLCTHMKGKVHQHTCEMVSSRSPCPLFFQTHIGRLLNEHAG